MRVISLDVGEKRIGMACSDALGITAQPLETLVRKNQKSDIEEIKGVILKMGVSKVIVGLPLNMDGTEGPMAKAAYKFVEYLKGGVSIPIELWDERLTTMEAERVLLGANLSRRKRKGLDDKLAAQLILQSYLAKDQHV
jgi:putative holliday junction resolvase